MKQVAELFPSETQAIYYSGSKDPCGLHQYINRTWLEKMSSTPPNGKY